MPDNGRATYECAWVAYLDAYGFSAETESRQDDRIASFFTAIANYLETSRGTVTKTFQFSDSVFIIQDGATQPLERFQEFHSAVSKVQSIALDFGFTFRGGVAFGQVTVGGFGFFGPPIVRAAKLEGALLGPLVALPQAEIDRAHDALARRPNSPQGIGVTLECVPVATKSGEILAHVLEPPIAKYLRNAHRQMGRALVRGPDHLVPAWRAAIAALNAAVKESDD